MARTRGRFGDVDTRLGAQSADAHALKARPGRSLGLIRDPAVGPNHLIGVVVSDVLDLPGRVFNAIVWSGGMSIFASVVIGFRDETAQGRCQLPGTPLGPVLQLSLALAGS
jgi:hypothetical protein